MADPRTHRLFGREFARQLWRLTRPFWTSEEAPRAALMLLGAIALELATVYGNVVLSQYQRHIFDALQDNDAMLFTRAVGLFLAIVTVFLLVSTYRVYIRQLLEIRWRRWLTDHYLVEWMDSQAYCQMELHEKSTDNPDQRIAEDVGAYVASALGLSLSLLSSLATLASFGGILWGLSAGWDLGLGEVRFHIPGFMMWVAIGYAGVATWFTHRVGRPLVPINFDQQRFEADFRFHLVRFRENVEPVAVSRGEEREREGALDRFHRVVGNFKSLIRAKRNLSLLTQGLGQANSVVPLLAAAPGFFIGRLKLGDVIQANIAYGQVSGALVWFVNAYQEIAEWRASVERLFTFSDAIEGTCAQRACGEGIQTAASTGDAIELHDLELELPGGRVLLDGANARIAPGDRVVVEGPSGSGKSTLFRALAGIWPFGRGRIEIPEKGKKMFLPQRPYLPIGTLRAALSYPSRSGTFSDDRLREVLAALDLGDLAGRLDEDAHWDQRLSGGEQQRLALARVLLHEPDWVFLDEATSGLDEPMEARAYALLTERLPHAAIVSIAHRKTVAPYHGRHWSFVPHGTTMALEAA